MKQSEINIKKNLMEKSFKQWAAVSLQIIKVKTVPVHHFYPIGLAHVYLTNNYSYILIYVKM